MVDEMSGDTLEAEDGRQRLGTALQLDGTRRNCTIPNTCLLSPVAVGVNRDIIVCFEQHRRSQFTLAILSYYENALSSLTPCHEGKNSDSTGDQEHLLWARLQLLAPVRALKTLLSR
jgi:hypothetical protein